MPVILVLSGSERAGSYNLKLADLAAAGLAARYAEAVRLSLRDLALPIYDGDDEAASGVPAGATRLRAAIDAADGCFIACPEYNSGYTPLLKNALDWASRVANASGRMTPVFGGKVVALAGASPGARGGYRALTQLRGTLELGFGALVLPEMASVPNAGSAFGEDGAILDKTAAAIFDAALMRLVALASRV